MARRSIFLGRMIFLGEGVAKDAAKSFFWLTLALAQDSKKAGALLRKVSGELSSDQITEANRAARAFRPK